MIGQTLSRYRILAKLGAGGMGEVYLAEDAELGRKVALKILPDAMAGDQERLERFRREARAVAALNHPNIVTIFNVEAAAGKRLLVMEHVAGESLDRLIPRHGLPLTRVFDIAIPIAEALAAAHDKGIAHRDLKPSNVMVGEDTSTGPQVKVLDFGLAKLAADTGPAGPAAEARSEAETQHQPSTLTGEGMVMGTAPYMSPEQLQGKPVDLRTDIFSFGVVLYEMVTGKRPFHGQTGIELASSILKDAPSPVVDVRDDVPRHLGRIIQHCLEKDPERRFQSAKDIRNELEGLRREVDSGVVETSASGHAAIRSAAPPGRRRAMTALAAAAAVVAVIALVLTWRGSSPDAPSAPREPAATSQPTIAVLPFRNMGADESVDYLSLAVPDEITTTLSRAAGLAVRPFAASSQSEAVDPLAAGRELAVDRVVTGQFFQEGERLNLTLESIDVDRNVVVWRESVVVEAQNLISLRSAVAETVERDLLPLLGASTSGLSAGTRPTNEEAYDLYLRSLAATSNAEPNAEALELLERAVELDPDYAPIWSELAIRYYYRGNYGLGTDADYDLAVAAARRALELDPDLIDPAVRLIVVAVERGRLAEAYDAAARLIAQRPDSPRAVFARGYVLRYGGDLPGALRDCDMALALDPRNKNYRSCGIANSIAGRYDRALRYLALDPTSGLALDNIVVVRLRQNHREEALEAMRQGVAEIWQTIIPHMEGRPFPPGGAQRIVDVVLSQRDSEQQYWAGSILAYCGEHAAALKLLREGIERGYCSYPFLDSDPLLDGLRADPASAADYAEIRAAGKACHDEFMAYVEG